MSKNAGANRNIRLTDEQWQDFRELLGIEWLRKQIARARKKAARADKCAPQ